MAVMMICVKLAHIQDEFAQRAGMAEVPRGSLPVPMLDSMTHPSHQVEVESEDEAEAVDAPSVAQNS